MHWGYHDIATKRTRYNRRQIDLLIKDAGARYWPVYALYDSDFYEHSRPLGCCPSCPRTAVQFQAMPYADANIVRALIQTRRLNLHRVQRISAPIPCIVDCRDRVKETPHLPQQVRAFATALWRRSISSSDGVSLARHADPPIPEIYDSLPDHVIAMRESSAFRRTDAR
jgi:hypothetical protein